MADIPNAEDLEHLEAFRQAKERQDRYLAQPDRCPYCGSSDLTAGSLTMDRGTCSQRIWCSDCDHSWYDCYALVGFTEP